MRASSAAIVCVLLSSMGCGLLLETDPVPPATSDGGARTNVDGGATVDGAVADGSTLDGLVVVPDDAGMPVRASACGGPETLRDDFEDGAVDPLWVSFASSGVEVRENRGRLEVRPATVTGHGGYRSKFAVDLTGSWFSARVPDTAGDAPGLVTYLKVSTLGALQQWMIVYENGQLHFIAMGVPSSGTGGEVIPYDRARHHFWRIREGGGSVFFETSPDGIVWTTHHEEVASEAITAVQMSVGAGSDVAGGSPGVAAFDDVNLDPPGGARTRFCPVSMLTDDFERATLRPLWSMEHAGCEVRLGGGVVKLAPRMATSGTCKLFTATAYDLEDGSTYAHIAPLAPETAMLAFTFAFTLHDRRDVEVSMTLLNGLLSLDSGAGSGSFPIGRDVAYWRLRDDPPSSVAMDASLDAVAWGASITAFDAGIDLSAVRIALELTIASEAPTDVTITVPSYGTR